MMLPIPKYVRKASGRWIEDAILAGVLVALSGLAVAATERLLRRNARAAISEPAHVAAASSANADFFFTHTVPPVIEEEEPDLKISVPIHNTTCAEVHFENVSRSCSCADAELKSRTLAAGAQTSLGVTIRTRGKSGMQRVRVDLTDSSGRQWKYLFATTVYPRARFVAPNEVLQVALSDPGQTATQQLDFEMFATRQDLLPELTGIVSEAPDFRVSMQRPIVGAVVNGLYVRRVPVTVSYRTPSTAGPYQVRLKAVYRFKTEDRTATLGISGFVRSRYEVSPQFVFFGQIPGSSTPNIRTVEIHRCDGNAFRVESVKVSSPKVVARIFPGDRANIVKVEAKFMVSELASPLWGEFTIRTNDPREPEIRLPFAAVPKKLSQTN